MFTNIWERIVVRVADYGTIVLSVVFKFAGVVVRLVELVSKLTFLLDIVVYIFV